jgi:hypothetical protein
MAAVQRKGMYLPKAADERAAISSYWNSPQRRAAGNDALVTKRIQLPFDEGEAYVVNPRIAEYINVLYIGQSEPDFSDADYHAFGSAELKKVLAEAENGAEVELEGALKCEALGYSLKHGTITPISDVVINPYNPMEGSVTFRVGEAVETTDAATEAEAEELATAAA